MPPVTRTEVSTTKHPVNSPKRFDLARQDEWPLTWKLISHLPSSEELIWHDARGLGVWTCLYVRFLHHLQRLYILCCLDRYGQVTLAVESQEVLPPFLDCAHPIYVFVLSPLPQFMVEAAACIAQDAEIDFWNRKFPEERTPRALICSCCKALPL